jgi:hypothetical protein
MPEPSQFRQYQIVQDTEGSNVELTRTAEQVAVLAFDHERLEFVACHVLLYPLQHRGQFDESCMKLRLNGHPLLARMVEYGEDEGNPFYITTSVDGESLRAYFNRQSDLSLLLATRISARALDTAIALLERGDLMPDAPLECMRLLQTSATDLRVVQSDYRIVDSPHSTRSKNRAVKGSIERQLKLLRSFLTEMNNAASPTVTEASVTTTDFSEILHGVLASSTPEQLPALAELRDILLKQLPEHLDSEIPTAQKPRALIAPLLASYQDVARSLVNQVRIQSQRLDMSNPYSMRGTLTRSGRPVMAEQIPAFRLSGHRAVESIRQVSRLTKQRTHSALLPIAHFSDQDTLPCVAEELPDGMNLAELLQSRGQLDVAEVYLILAGIDAALTQVEQQGFEIKKMRLEDIYLLAGISRDDARIGQLLHVKLTDWPAFTAQLRGHATLASIAARGTDPAVLLPARLAGSRSPAWTGSWLAAIGCFLCGLYHKTSSSPLPSSNSTSEREAVTRMLMDELIKGREGGHATRQDFLARLARIIRHHDLAQPSIAPASATTGVASPLTAFPAPVALTQAEFDVDDSKEEFTVGFAELLINHPSSTAGLPASSPNSPWEQGASAELHQGEVGDWALVPDDDPSPFWLKATVFIAGSMVLGAAIATFNGKALWSKKAPLSPTAPAAQTTPAKR